MNQVASGGPLAGTKIIELASWAAGPSCCAVLADSGAEVIKVEHPVTGDPIRGTFAGSMTTASDYNYLWHLYNHNKKSIGLDLRQEDGRRVIGDLIANSDVFVSNHLDRQLKRYGLDYGTLARRNPRLIYGHVSGYGTRGELADKVSFDIMAQARSGLLWLLHEVEAPFPPISLRGMLDRAAGAVLAGGVTTALCARQRTGRGQEVQVSLVGVAMWLAGRELGYTLTSKQNTPRMGHCSAANPLFNLYRTRDNRWLVLGMTKTDLYWEEFCEALGEPRLRDERFGTHAGIVEHSRALIELLDEIFAGRDLNEWVERLDESNLMWDVVQTPVEAAMDAQVRENGIITLVDHPGLGSSEMVSSPLQYSEPSPATRAAPELGEQTEEILLSLGYDWESIAALKVKGAII